MGESGILLDIFYGLSIFNNGAQGSYGLTAGDIFNMRLVHEPCRS